MNEFQTEAVLEPLDEEFYVDCWDMVRLTESELDELCEAVDRGDSEGAEAVVDRAYDRLFGETVN